jgi:hypothetical protein
MPLYVTADVCVLETQLRCRGKWPLWLELPLDRLHCHRQTVCTERFLEVVEHRLAHLDSPRVWLAPRSSLLPQLSLEVNPGLSSHATDILLAKPHSARRICQHSLLEPLD